MRTKAFSLIELLVTLSIGLLLMTMAVPAFSKLARKSRVQQAAETVVSAVNMATQLSVQLNRPEAVVVYFGDDRSKMATQPTPGVLPKYGNIEIWTAKAYGSGPPQINPGWNNPPWVPFHTPLEPLTTQSFTFPDGIRIITGWVSQVDSAFVPWAHTPVYKYTLNFSDFNKTDPRGEIKRHYIGLVNGAGYVQGNSQEYSYSDVLIFDVLTGEHLLVRATGSRFGDTTNVLYEYKARIMTDPATHENIQLWRIQAPVATTNDYKNYYITQNPTDATGKIENKYLPGLVDK
jgi:prepilin-type N-terminal cleavage/methylation domain-containing protein